MSAIAAYVRVSTRQQDLQAQIDAISKASSARGEPIATWFSEKIGGHRMKRPELDRLREGVRRGEFSKVYVFRIDRLSRSGIAETLNVIEELRNGGCLVESVADPFGAALSGPLGELLLSLLAWAAQQERRALNDRLHAARERTEARGGSWGRPKRLSADTVRLALTYIAGGDSIRLAARKLQISKTTLARELSRNPQELDRALSASKTSETAT